MKYENRGNDIIKIENGVEYVMVACKVNGMDSFVWDEIKPEVKSLCIPAGRRARYFHSLQHL